MAHAYSHLFGLPTIGLRFFTVYGPWGRPDMALFLFTKAILENKPISIFNNGHMTRDFTYIDDIVQSIYLLLDKPALPDPEFDHSNPHPAKSWAPFRIFNIGNSNPVSLMKYIEVLEDQLGSKSQRVLLPMQPGDVQSTSADTDELARWIGFQPSTPIEIGIRNFVQWYRSYYQ